MESSFWALWSQAWAFYISLSIPRPACVVKPSVKCLLGKWLNLTIIFTLKSLMEKLAWLIFDWLAHYDTWTHSFEGGHGTCPVCRSARSGPVWCPCSAPVLEGSLWAAGPELLLGEGPDWSRAKRGDWTTQGTQHAQPKGTTVPQTTPRAGLYQEWFLVCDMTFYFFK